MSRFVDEIDRLFEELVHEAWRGSHPARRQQPPPPSDVEFQLPVAGAGRSDITFTTEGGQLTVTVRQRATGDREPSGSPEDRETQSEQTYTFPAGTEPAAVEARFEGDSVRVRVSLRRTGRA